MIDASKLPAVRDRAAAEQPADAQPAAAAPVRLRLRPQAPAAPGQAPNLASNARSSEP